MRNAMVDLKLKRLDLIHAGDETFPMGKNIRAVIHTRKRNLPAGPLLLVYKRLAAVDKKYEDNQCHHPH